MIEPTIQEKNHSIKVINHIKQKINDAGGNISFADFMHEALYAPNIGYYNNKICQKFGKSGDFVTAPMLGELFAICVASQCSDILQHLNNHNILELGAGDGQLAYQLIKYLSLRSCKKINNIKLNNYFILEPSTELQIRQKKMLLNSNLNTDYRNKISWITSVPENFTGIILANEVLDAIPVNLFKIKNQQIFEILVTLKNNDFDFIEMQASKHIFNKISKLPINKTNYINNNTYSSEICLLIPNLIKSLSTNLKNGAILLFDYGFLDHEYYHHDRNCGTLMCHYKHHSHTNPFFLPGLQDITAHVDFSMIMQCATNNKLRVNTFSSLANFLINNNLQKEFTKKIKILNQLEKYRIHQEINTLLSPSEMGEIFKVLLLETV